MISVDKNIQMADNEPLQSWIIVVHYGDVTSTQRTIAGLRALCLTNRLVIVANDDARVSDLDSCVEWVVAPSNLGYFGAVKFFLEKEVQGGRSLPSGPVFILNNDLLTDFGGQSLAGSVQELIHVFADSRVGLAGPILCDVSPEGERALGPLTFPRFVSLKRARTHGSFETVDWLAGAVLAVASDLVLDAVDGTYFLGGEDLDLSYRVWRKDRLVIRVNVKVGHYTSSTIGSRSWSYLGPRGVNRFLRQHNQRLALAFAIVRDVAAALRHVIRAIRASGYLRTEELDRARLRLLGTLDGALGRDLRKVVYRGAARS
jgi:GT2 family glycosyltransferase